MIYVEKVIIVEGTSDRRKIESIIREPVEIVCTNGTIGLSKMDELVDRIFDKEVYVLVDADDAGEKLRKQFRKEFPQAEHIYIDRSYRSGNCAIYTLSKCIMRPTLTFIQNIYGKE